MKAWEWINRIAAMATLLGLLGVPALKAVTVNGITQGVPDWLVAAFKSPVVGFITTNYIWFSAVSLFLLLFILLMEAVRRYRRQKNAWLLISQIYNQIHEQYKDMLSAIMTQKTYSDPQAQAEAEARLKLHLRDFFENTLRQMAEVFTTYTGKECRTCFKGYNPDAHEVLAGHRCAKSQRERAPHDQGELKRFHIRENTAFETLIKSDSHAFFAASDLKKLSRQGRYKNLNKN